jgi:hypothetical protein
MPGCCGRKVAMSLRSFAGPIRKNGNLKERFFAY